jgi:hypothetical protein
MSKRISKPQPHAGSGGSSGGESPVVVAGLTLIGGPILLGLLIWVGGHFRDRTGPLPAELEVQEQLFVDESSGLMEGCGLYVYRLTEASRIDLVNKGLSKLESARTGREQPSYHRYERWTPIPKEFSIRGRSCVELPRNISTLIDNALKSAFVTKGYEFDLLVDPITGLVVFSFNG